MWYSCFWNTHRWHRKMFWTGRLKSKVVKRPIYIPCKVWKKIFGPIFQLWRTSSHRILLHPLYTSWTPLYSMAMHGSCMLWVCCPWQEWYSPRAKELRLLAEGCINPSLHLPTELLLLSETHMAQSPKKCINWQGTTLRRYQACRRQNQRATEKTRKVMLTWQSIYTLDPARLVPTMIPHSLFSG